MLALDEMHAAFNELKTVGRRRKDFFADESYGFGVGIDHLAKALQPLRCVHRIADNRVVDPIRRADIADNDLAHVDAHADTNRLQSGGHAAFVVRRERSLDGDGSPASRSGRVLNAAGRPPKGHDGVADEFIDRAAFPFDAGRDEREVLIDEAGDLGGGHSFARRCEADDVGEHDGKHTFFCFPRPLGPR